MSQHLRVHRPNDERQLLTVSFNVGDNGNGRLQPRYSLQLAFIRND